MVGKEQCIVLNAPVPPQNTNEQKEGAVHDLRSTLTQTNTRKLEVSLTNVREHMSEQMGSTQTNLAEKCCKLKDSLHTITQAPAHQRMTTSLNLVQKRKGNATAQAGQET
jgi:hypothetical protein